MTKPGIGKTVWKKEGTAFLLRTCLATLRQGMGCALAFSPPQGLSVSSYSNLTRGGYYPHFTDAEPEAELFRDLWRSQRAKGCKSTHTSGLSALPLWSGQHHDPGGLRGHTPSQSVTREGKASRLPLLRSLWGFVNRVNQ